MGKYIDEYLGPSYDIGEYSLGSDRLMIPGSHDEILDRMWHLRDQTRRLRESQHPDDTWAIYSTNQRFYEHDSKLARQGLDRHLEKPLTPDIYEWITSARDEDLLQFCNWSLWRTRELTWALKRDKPGLVNNTLEKTHELVKIGLFPSMAIPAMETSTDRYPLWGMDSFHGPSGILASCASHAIYMSNMYKNKTKLRGVTNSMRSIHFHEQLHGAGRYNGWFFEGVKTPLPVLGVIEEAFVEHATVVAYANSFGGKEPHIIDPRTRSNTKHHDIYPSERTFLAHALGYTGMAYEQLSDMYFRPRGDERGEWLREDAERRLGRFFGSRQHFFDFAAEYQEAPYTARPEVIYHTINRLTTVSQPELELETEFHTTPILV